MGYCCIFLAKYRITAKVAKAWMSIAADRQVVTSLPLTAPMLDENFPGRM